MKRSCLILCTAATAAALALPGFAHAATTNGWSWNENAPAVSDPGMSNPSIDGWSWGDEPE